LSQAESRVSFFSVDPITSDLTTIDMTGVENVAASESIFASTFLPAGDYLVTFRTNAGLTTIGEDGTAFNLADSQFSLTARAVPEPATLAVLGLGALALRRRRPRA
jgi:hypothetical protein